MSEAFCSTCGSRKYLVHLDGCSSWQIPIAFLEPGPAFHVEAARGAQQRGEPVSLPTSQCSCSSCQDGACAGNPWCHCRDGILDGLMFAEIRKIERRRPRGQA